MKVKRKTDIHFDSDITDKIDVSEIDAKNISMYPIWRRCFLSIFLIWTPFNKRSSDYQKWKLREKTNIHLDPDIR